MNGTLKDRFNGKKPNNWLQAFMLFTLLVFAAPVLADEVHIFYIDDANEEQTLIIDANSSAADNELAATLILELTGNMNFEASKILVILDGKEDLEVIAAAVSAYAPDEATKTAISNTILGVSPFLGGGRSIQRTAQQPDVSPAPVATPPVPFPEPPPPPPPPSSSIPAPSSSVVSPN